MPLLDSDAAFRRHINDANLLVEQVRKKDEGGQPPSPEEEVREEADSE